MRLFLKDDLPFTTVTAAYQGKATEISDILVDTGSATTVLSADALHAIRIVPLPEDTLHVIRGVGGSELVFSRRMDYLQVGTQKLSDFETEIGGMDYGFEINGILGMDFLSRAEAVINLRTMTIEFYDGDVTV
ncbi:retropepsin-like aspartic protease [Desulfonema magnum]|uniref:Aspartyl protease domain-containing protein n=1 Tax=Desulfonema magnum TaxID=45655 RepID=A0A975BG79_9BACT|nr:retropepsin-like aspartic protease [Desulfonema magnum]QTA84723.1 Aspartyl protease domain-containing protein [Desulfonema magnum]